MRTRVKACIKCGEVLPLDSFYAHKKMADGHLNKCKTCVKADVTARAKAEPEKIAAYERKRWERPARRKAVAGYLKRARKKDPERFRRYVRESIARHPERRKARQVVGNSVRDGRLTKKPCKRCGAKKVHAHHTDYSKPLKVTWLCSKCHGLEHRRHKEVHAKKSY